VWGKGSLGGVSQGGEGGGVSGVGGGFVSPVNYFRVEGLFSSSARGGIGRGEELEKRELTKKKNLTLEEIRKDRDVF